MAECHPVGFQWVMEAKLAGATVIHVDPRFTRTSANASFYVPIRAGSDIAFLGGLVRYILENERFFREYVLHYTNAATIVSEDFRDAEDLDGYFSGFDAEKRTYARDSWQYAGAERDLTLTHPRCVFQLLKRHFQRYTPEMVERTCGVPRDMFLKVAEALCANSGRERTSALVYSVGWTQHTVGAQTIRAGAIVQLLLGNVGRPGGGVLALRGHASIQGSTDIPTLYDLLPGYIPMPRAGEVDLQAFVDRHTEARGGWGNLPAYLVSLLKAWWGDAAIAENDFCYGYLPRIDASHHAYKTALDMLDGRVEGYFLLGENPAVGSANSGLHRRALAKLRWLVVRDLYEIESAAFWNSSPEVQSGELRTEDIGTEVFFLPAAAHTEKDGSFTNTQRLLQWHHTAVEPRQDCRSDLWFLYNLGRIIRRRLEGSAEPRDRPVLDLTWDYPTAGRLAEPSADAVLQEINGWGAGGSPLSAATQLRADGSTACGCWIYCGSHAAGVNQAARRRPGREQSWVASEWGWAWPNNRRMLYNRASADPEGRPWSERKKYVWWDAEKGEWTGQDVPDFTKDKPPHYRPEAGAGADAALSGDAPFIMHGDGRGWLFAPSGVVDGPFPTHFEPHESPAANPLYGVSANPTRERFEDRFNRYQDGDRRFPFVMTTYRLTEHHTAGGMSRNLPVLSQLQPEMFCEVSPALARERGLEHGGWATIVTERRSIEARVNVTARMTPLAVGGRTVHQVGLPYHWGTRGIVTGDSANDLFPIVLDPNVHIQEVKAATCDIRPGRRPRP